jgi:hypothetical protein
MIHWLRRETTFVSEPPLEERELLAALRVSSENKLWIALLQIIEEELRQVREMAKASVKEHGVLASWVGGAEALERLRDRLIQDRARAIGKE